MRSNFESSRKYPLVAAALALALCGSAAQAHAEASKHADANQGAVALPTEAAASGVVNVNTATEAELVRLPGVGPSRAQAILELRTRMKHFARLEDLMRVKGIGRATFRKLRPMLTLEGATTLAVQSPARAHRVTEVTAE